ARHLRDLPRQPARHMHACPLEPVPPLQEFGDPRRGNCNDCVTSQGLRYAIQEPVRFPAPGHRTLGPGPPQEKMDLSPPRGVELAEDKPDRPEVVMPQDEDTI